MYRAQVTITLKPTVLDAQGATVERALHNLGFEAVDGVRMGKYIEVGVDAPDADTARRQVDEMCQKLLANPVIEEYRIEVVSAGG
ncbi:MAG: phosphoribosylformylglycinamidine synthase subunit PurS [Armatimonadota bacterium]|nr:MAG: phosphoribosylformylglycinamidine synthase subunit PurS [Armatimonadota bacterium]